MISDFEGGRESITREASSHSVLQGCKVTRGKGNDCVPCVYYGTEYLAQTKQPAKKPVCLLYSRGNHYDLLVK